MFLSQLYLKNFRNYKHQHLKFNQNLNLIVGANAQGKTNILEAIYLLGTGNSHRTNLDSELVNWNKDNFYIKGELIKKSQNYQLEVNYQGRNKIIKINSNKLQRISDLVGYLNIVIFSPEDLSLVKGSPSRRRKFINLEVSQISSYYKHLLTEYGKILKQRNNLLKEIRDNNIPQHMLQVWEQQLIDTGSKIIKRRLEALDKLSILAKLMQRKITDGKETLLLKYDTKLEINTESSIQEIKEQFKYLLNKKREREIEHGVTKVGPHRDDISLIVNNIDIRKFGSQGQQRTTALAIKLAELEFMKAEIGEYPILLLDDVFSELDEGRRFKLLKVIQNKIQTFITTTHLKQVQEFNGKHKFFKIKKGSVIEG
ncbi:DNA replication/repair protein RecF [Natroniella acetigena]|uniref:DNA replication/repair protein RecF n=1 Tax=Natroniella acetigena TaxID=52004 RepID=UPI00200AE9E6|nr:DNA replication/repair protein RecF [Natroniella acetigena]MCK8826833.1 DNA replication/repair protein RecF [Natroniella acetigena]